VGKTNKKVVEKGDISDRYETVRENSVKILPCFFPMLAGAHATNSGLNLGVDSRRRPKTCSNIFKLDSSKTPARGLSHAMKQFLYISGSDAAINSTFLDSRCIEVEAATIYKDAIRTWGLST
jgi:hypothetical protein